MLRAFLVKHLEEIKTIPRLVDYLESYSAIAELCGFDKRASLPDESQFYYFLKTTNNSMLQQIYYRINKKSIEDDVISLDTFIIDSKSVLAATKDNNLKNPHRNTTDKYNKPKRNPAATLGYFSYQNSTGINKEATVLLRISHSCHYY